MGEVLEAQGRKHQILFKNNILHTFAHRVQEECQPWYYFFLVCHSPYLGLAM